VRDPVDTGEDSLLVSRWRWCQGEMELDLGLDPWLKSAAGLSVLAHLLLAMKSDRVAASGE